MSKKKGRHSRLSFFDRGNTRCPICLAPFKRSTVEMGLHVTLEHVPPKTLGGSVRCLTCANCNRSASRNLDQAAAMMNSAMIDQKDGRGTKVLLDVCGTKHTTYFSQDGAANSEPVRRLASSLSARTLRKQLSGRKILLFAELKRGPDWDVSKGITLSIKQPARHHVLVSWLRSAYLLVFSLLGRAGYRYAESEAIRPIREQIMKPDDELVPSLLCDLSPLSSFNDLIIMNNQHRPFCWIVKVGNLGMLLPRGSTAKHYTEVVELPDQINIGRKWRAWRPASFGKQFSFELTLREGSDQVDKELFGNELTVPAGEYEQRCVVANQQGSICDFLPFAPATRVK